jgi:hypothetical protein
MPGEMPHIPISPSLLGHIDWYHPVKVMLELHPMYPSHLDDPDQPLRLHRRDAPLLPRHPMDPPSPRPPHKWRLHSLPRDRPSRCSLVRMSAELVRISCGKERYDVHGRFWLLRWRWRRAIRRKGFLRLVCSDGKVRWFNACQISVMGQGEWADR